jgi:hypothetical protein
MTRNTDIRRLVCLTVVLSAVHGCSTGSIPPTPEPSPTATLAATVTPSRTATLTPTTVSADAEYAALLERLKQNDPALDFTALRMAYAGSSGYDPYGYEAGFLLMPVQDALEAQDFELAEDLLDQTLEAQYLHYWSQATAFTLYNILEREDRVEHHRYVLNGIAESISRSGDGQGVETAFAVVSVDEEYLMLDWLNIEFTSQTLSEDGGHEYDVMEGKDRETGKSVVVYFNIDLLYAWMADNF